SIPEMSHKASSQTVRSVPFLRPRRLGEAVFTDRQQKPQEENSHESQEKYQAPENKQTFMKKNPRHQHAKPPATAQSKRRQTHPKTPRNPTKHSKCWQKHTPDPKADQQNQRESENARQPSKQTATRANAAKTHPLIKNPCHIAEIRDQDNRSANASRLAPWIQIFPGRSVRQIPDTGDCSSLRRSFG
ncbi:hypothetical protein PAF17_11290, partial [Paracoccus sp. Z330]